VCIIERNLWISFQFFSFGIIIGKIQIIKFEVLCNVEMKYGLNRINIRLFTQQARWLGGKGVEFHLWSPRIKLYKWHALWSSLEYWLSIMYLLRLPRLGGYLGESN
jgi:hypothetical protein